MFIINIISGSCNTNTNNVNSIEELVEVPVIFEDSVLTLFDFCNVDSMSYCESDDAHIIYYDDPDAFDYDNLAYNVNKDNWYGNYIKIIIEDWILPDFIDDMKIYRNTNDWEIKEEMNRKYSIAKHSIIYSNSDKDIIFYLSLDRIDVD